MRFKETEHNEVESLYSKEGVVIADVRDKSSYDEAHIPEALHLSIEKLQEFCDEADKSQAILVYCYHGIMCQSVAQHLLNCGFQDVYVLKGGFEVWRENHTTSSTTDS